MIPVFDFFGVVIKWSSDDVMPDWAAYAHTPREKFKAAYEELLERCETGEISMAAFWEGLARKFNVDAAGLERILKERFKSQARLDEGVVSIIQKLPDAVLLSNQMPLHAVMARQNGWFSYFRAVFLSYELGFRKPDPRAYERLIEELGVDPSRIVLIDDKKKNVDAAVAMGMRGIVYENPEQLRRELAKFYKFGEDGKWYDAA